jgi:hypothetical protein
MASSDRAYHQISAGICYHHPLAVFDLAIRLFHIEIGNSEAEQARECPQGDAHERISSRSSTAVALRWAHDLQIHRVGDRMQLGQTPFRLTPNIRQMSRLRNVHNSQLTSSDVNTSNGASFQDGIGMGVIGRDRLEELEDLL